MNKISTSAFVEIKDGPVHWWNRQQDFWDLTPCNWQIGNHVPKEPASPIILMEEAAGSSAVFVLICQMI
jgi:hypothetical protein